LLLRASAFHTTAYCVRGKCFKVAHGWLQVAGSCVAAFLGRVQKSAAILLVIGVSDRVNCQVSWCWHALCKLIGGKSFGWLTFPTSTVSGIPLMSLLSRVAFAAPTFPFVICAVATCLLTGCGSSVDGRYGVSGTVTFKSAPLDTGAIEFVSNDGSQQSGATITNGAYSIPAGKGLKPGKYKVKITSTDGAAAAAGPPGPESMGAAGKEKLPPEYNSATTQSVEVTSSGANTFDFDIP